LSMRYHGYGYVTSEGSDCLRLCIGTVSLNCPHLDATAISVERHGRLPAMPLAVRER